jgi:hypothetical protein
MGVGNVDDGGGMGYRGERRGGVKERPILFNGAMVRAVMAGVKTQTRRVVKSRHWPEPLTPGYEWFFDQTTTEQVWEVGAWNAGTGEGQLHSYITCPYGKPGDRLWVRETWQRNADFPDTRSNGLCVYRADRGGDTQLGDGQRWIPSIHMPRWASRLTLDVLSVDVQRLQDISESDALAEGVDTLPDDPCAYSMFAMLWDSINAERGYGWHVNPWVWVVEFKVVGQAKGGAGE